MTFLHVFALIMTREERGEFVELMLNQVIDTLKEAGIEKMAL